MSLQYCEHALSDSGLSLLRSLRERSVRVMHLGLSVCMFAFELKKLLLRLTWSNYYTRCSALIWTQEFI